MHTITFTGKIWVRKHMLHAYGQWCGGIYWYSGNVAPNDRKLGFACWCRRGFPHKVGLQIVAVACRKVSQMSHHYRVISSGDRRTVMRRPLTRILINIPQMHSPNTPASCVLPCLPDSTHPNSWIAYSIWYITTR